MDSAHREAKGTIVDLRDLARGIHPPALDNGLPDALRTLTARCAIPTILHIDLPDRPSPAIETIVYFCTAELLTNIVKHSGAHHASVDVRMIDDHLFVRVGDDGAGGAAVTRSGGSLAGLTDRVATVDGRLDIASPEGGPSLVTIEIRSDAHRDRRGLGHPAGRVGAVAHRPRPRGDRRRRRRDGTGCGGRPDVPDFVVVDIRMPPTHTQRRFEAAIALRASHPGLGILVFSQYVETRYAAELLAAGSERVGYLLKDRVADVSEFIDALTRIAAGGTVLDPEVVTQLLGASRRTDSVDALTARERQVLRLMAEGRANAAIAASLHLSRRRRETRHQHLRKARPRPVLGRPSPGASGFAVARVLTLWGHDHTARPPGHHSRGRPDHLRRAGGRPVALVVNVASKCGLTPQYSIARGAATRAADQRFTVLGFPCNQFGEQEPG